MGNACCSKSKKRKRVKECSLAHVMGSSPEQNGSSMASVQPHEQENTPVLNWKRGDLIAEGAYGKVYQCLNTDTGQMYVTKHVAVSGDPRKIAREVENLKLEISMLKELSHKNIVRYIHTEINPEKTAVDIIMEYVSGGSLREMLKKFHQLTENMTRIYIKQLLDALVYLHGKGIVHRDIKSANLLVDREGTIKLTDFGASKRLPTGEMLDGYLCKSLKGSPYWMAPEVVRREGHHFAADIWSVGCVIIEMLTGSPPWSNISRKVSDVLKILATTTTRPELPRNISKECRNFIQQCLQINPARRPTAEDLLNHPFILNTKLPESMDFDEDISSFPSNTSELRDFVPLTLQPSSRLCNIEDNQHSGSDRLSSLNVIDENVQSSTTSASTNARHLLETLDSPATGRGRFLLEPIELPESRIRLKTPLIEVKYDERFARDSSSTNFSSYRNEKGEDPQEVKQVTIEKEMRRKRSKSKRTS